MPAEELKLLRRRQSHHAGKSIASAQGAVQWCAARMDLETYTAAAATAGTAAAAAAAANPDNRPQPRQGHGEL